MLKMRLNFEMMKTYQPFAPLHWTIQCIKAFKKVNKMVEKIRTETWIRSNHIEIYPFKVLTIFPKFGLIRFECSTAFNPFHRNGIHLYNHIQIHIDSVSVAFVCWFSVFICQRQSVRNLYFFFFRVVLLPHPKQS